ncbi:hypothetical protein D3C87_1214700 [compost metagenome]
MDQARVVGRNFAELGGQEFLRLLEIEGQLCQGDLGQLAGQTHAAHRKRRGAARREDQVHVVRAVVQKALDQRMRQCVVDMVIVVDEEVERLARLAGRIDDGGDGLRHRKLGACLGR